jgi:hypothetical protein
LSLELNSTIDCGEGGACPNVAFRKASFALGDGITANFRLYEGQAVSFILRDADDHDPEQIDTALVDELQLNTHKYWSRWISQSKYQGRWEEVVTRSLLLLKLLIFEPTGAICAAPTFSLPEDVGGMWRRQIFQRLANENWRLAQLGLPILLDKRCFIYNLHFAPLWIQY